MRLFSRTIALIVFAACLTAASYASSPDLRFTSGNSATKIPFELHNNQVHLQVSVNGSSPVWVVLDTGATTIISRGLAQRLNLKLREQGEFTSKESRAFKYAFTSDVSFKLPGADFTLKKTLVVAFEDLAKCLGRPVEGVLGQELFNSSVIKIDYKQRFINVHEPRTFKYSGNGKAVSLEQMSNGQITVRAEVTPANRPPFAGRFLVDTGFALSLSLNTHTVERNKLLAEDQKEEFQVCGFGESKAIKGKVPSVRIDSFKFDNVNTLFSRAQRGDMAAEDIDGFIGGEILGQFKVIFDYSRKQMILE